MNRDFKKNIITYLNPLKNIHLLVILLFAIWMFFFDANKVSNQVKTSNKLASLESEHEDLSKKIDETTKELEGLKVNKEKFAREQYYMKKDDEDVFIIELNLSLIHI